MTYWDLYYQLALTSTFHTWSDLGDSEDIFIFRRKYLCAKYFPITHCGELIK